MELEHSGYCAFSITVPRKWCILPPHYVLILTEWSMYWFCERRHVCLCFLRLIGRYIIFCFCLDYFGKQFFAKLCTEHRQRALSSGYTTFSVCMIRFIRFACVFFLVLFFPPKRSEKVFT